MNPPSCVLGTRLGQASWTASARESIAGVLFGVYHVSMWEAQTVVTWVCIRMGCSEGFGHRNSGSHRSFGSIRDARGMGRSIL